jgi:hypothetical protein
MKHPFNRFALTLSKYNQQHVRLALIILSLAMLVIGAGAPAIGGEIGN